MSGTSTGRHLDRHRVLVLHDETIPLPREIVVRRLRSASETAQRRQLVGEVNVPAPATRVGDRLRENVRRVRRYRPTFPDGRVLEADIDVGVAENVGLRFLPSLRPAESSL